MYGLLGICCELYSCWDLTAMYTSSVEDLVCTVVPAIKGSWVNGHMAIYIVDGTEVSDSA